MLLILVLAWVVGIPVAVIGAASAYAWHRDRRLASTVGVTSARVYRLVRPTSRSPSLRDRATAGRRARS
jgi:hypothetical protein